MGNKLSLIGCQGQSLMSIALPPGRQGPEVDLRPDLAPPLRPLSGFWGTPSTRFGTAPPSIGVWGTPSTRFCTTAPTRFGTCY